METHIQLKGLLSWSQSITSNPPKFCSSRSWLTTATPTLLRRLPARGSAKNNNNNNLKREEILCHKEKKKKKSAVLCLKGSGGKEHLLQGQAYTNVDGC